MSNKHISVVITKNDLDRVVSRASLAAMSEEGQSDISRSNNETKGCVRVTASGNTITFDSSASRFSSRYSITTGEGSESSIESEGDTCIPAKDLKSVSSKIKDGKIRLTFISKPSDQDANASAALKSMLPDGVVEVSVIKGAKNVAKAKIEAYPAAYFSCPDFQTPDTLNTIVSGKASDIKNPYGLVGFSINLTDAKEVYNKFAIFPSPDSVFFLGSDGRRCAVVQTKGETSGMKFMTEEPAAPILIDSEFMNPILSSLDAADDLLLAMNASEEHVYMFSGQTSYRISMADKELRKKFPNYKRIMGLDKKVVILVNRDELSTAINLLGVVNIDRGRYVFCKDEKAIKLQGRGIAGVKEATGEVSYELVSECQLGDGDNEKAAVKDPAISLHTGYLIEGLKKMSCDKVRMSFTPDELRVRIEDETDPKFIYYMQVMNPNEV